MTAAAIVGGPVIAFDHTRVAVPRPSKLTTTDQEMVLLNDMGAQGWCLTGISEPISGPRLLYFIRPRQS